jgi:hypothetical protein
MQGFYTATVLDSKGQGDAPFLEAMKRGNLDPLLTPDRIVKQVKSQNMILQNMMQWLFYECFGAPEVLQFSAGTAGNRGLWGVALTTASSEPVYTEKSGTEYTQTLSIDHDWCFTYPYRKVIIYDRAEPLRIWADPDGRDGYYFRHRYLWLPSEGSYSNIRSVEVWYCDDADSQYSTKGTNATHYYANVARTRIKDSGGTPQSLIKTGDQAFMIEILFKMFSR